MANAVLRSRWVMARGVKTHYTESGGDGKVLVALHGGGAGSSGVAGMGLVMEKLADDFRCRHTLAIQAFIGIFVRA